MKNLSRFNVLILLVIIVFTSDVSAQYFGRNKARYKDFDFKVLKTPNFDLHYYSKNKAVVDQYAQWAEMWYDYHRQIVGEEFSKVNPIILYNNHADFQQTNTIQGDIGVGTGGVTEAFKNRVVMPLTFSNQQTYHVLGHELVHAFQFNSILNGDSTDIQSLGNLPLWIVEGMAEYLTLGRVDPFTSMWMRDAILQDKVPTLEQMANPRYFPYRYGQAAWSVLTGIYGDQVIKPFFKATAIYGLDYACQLVFEQPIKELSKVWIESLTNHYNPYLRTKSEKPQGKLLFNKDNAGGLNVSPALSNNGRYMVFLSEKDLFTTDLFLADVRTGKILSKLASLVKDGDLDNLNFLESSGTFSPNGKDFAFVAFKKGKNVLITKDVDSGKTIGEDYLKGVDAIASPVWSPDGKSIVVCGLVEGQADLFQMDMRSKRVTQLTNDLYSEILPNFNLDGTKLTFSYDKRSMEEGRVKAAITYDIAVMDMAYNSIEILDIFHGAENLNPCFDHEGNIYFVSERDGFRNLYRYIVTSKEVHQMTDLLTGVSGIARYSPMISVSTKTDKVVYTHYEAGKYNIWEGRVINFLNAPVDSKITDMLPGILPVVGKNVIDVVNRNLREADNYEFDDPSTFEKDKYRPKFKLDYIAGSTGVGVGNNTFGTANAVQGGIGMQFSDMLGNNQLGGQVSASGQIQDIAGMFVYENLKGRMSWGIGVSHLVQPLGSIGYQFPTIDLNNNPTVVLEEQLNILRVFNEGAMLFTKYPFSSTMRIEGALRGSYSHFRYDRYSSFYLPFGNQYQFLGQSRERIPIPDTLAFNQYYTLIKGAGASANVALVGDNSFFGVTSPLAGHRYRLAADYFVGVNQYASITADYRKYIWKKPFSYAFRLTSDMRFIQNVNSVFPYFVGQMGFVRGFGTQLNNNFFNQINNDELIGSRIAVASAEIRMPFTGPKQLALIGSSFLLTDLNLFFDAGVAYDRFSELTTGETVRKFILGNDGLPLRDPISGQALSEEVTLRAPIVRTAGISARINLLGYLVVEPYYAWQLTKGGTRGFGLNIIPGW
jgi:hypothetical protein